MKVEMSSERRKCSTAPTTTITLSVIFLMVLVAQPAQAFVGEVVAVIAVVKQIGNVVKTGWNIMDKIADKSEKGKTKDVLKRLNDVSTQIQRAEEKYAGNIALAVESVHSVISKETRLMAKMDVISETMNRITTRYQQMLQYCKRQDKMENTTLLSFAKWTVSPNGDSVHHLMERLSLGLLGLENKVDTTNNILLELAKAYEESSEKICHSKQSAQQFIYSLYTDIALTELKGYTMIEFSWMILRMFDKGNFTEEVKLMRTDYERRTERLIVRLREVLRQADLVVWTCDPAKHEKGKTYEEVTKLLQGYVENEAYSSTRRYEYIENKDGSILGQKSYCDRGTIKVKAWRRLWERCSYCFCLCDEIGLKSDRYFNLKDVLADVANNKVVTGLRMVKQNRVFHMQIQEGELMPRGTINASSLAWKPTEAYTIDDPSVRNGFDYHTLSYDSRSIDLDDIYTGNTKLVVTGVAFRIFRGHLNLAARLSKHDFETGKLLRPEEASIWRSNSNTAANRVKLELNEPDDSSRMLFKSRPDSRHNEYIDFVNTSMEKDAAQSTVPFIDIQDVVSNPPAPLSGIGIYHKGRTGYGGYLAPKIMTYDFSAHV